MKILLVLLTVSTAYAGGKNVPQEPTPKVEPSPMPSPSVEPTPSKGYTFKCVTCTEAERAKVAKASVLVNDIVKSSCFHDFMVKGSLLETQGRTKEQVVSHLANASVTLPVHFYSGRCKVVGYHNPGEPDIYLNRCSHDHYGPCDEASNMAHEASHELGYTHPFKATPTRGDTTPYKINRAFDACCADSKGFRNHD